MRTRLARFLLPLGAALVGAASVAQAQPGARITICRDGAELATRNGAACYQHRGVNVRATQIARQQNAAVYTNPGYGVGRVGQGGLPAGDRRAAYDAERRDAALRDEQLRAQRRGSDDRQRTDRERTDRRHDDRASDPRHDSRDDRHQR